MDKRVRCEETGSSSDTGEMPSIAGLVSEAAVYAILTPDMLFFFTATRLPSHIACSEKVPLALPVLVNLVVRVLAVFKGARGRGKTMWPSFEGESTGHLVIAASDSCHTVVSR